MHSTSTSGYDRIGTDSGFIAGGVAGALKDARLKPAQMRSHRSQTVCCIYRVRHAQLQHERLPLKWHRLRLHAGGVAGVLKDARLKPAQMRSHRSQTVCCIYRVRHAQLPHERLPPKWHRLRLHCGRRSRRPPQLPPASVPVGEPAPPTAVRFSRRNRAAEARPRESCKPESRE